MRYKFKLIRGRSYVGLGIKTSAAKPFVIVTSKYVADFLVACKRFALVETISQDETKGNTLPENNTPPNSPPEDFPNERWTVGQLQAYAEENGIPLDGARTKAEILARIQQALAESVGDNESGEIDYTGTP